MAITRIIILLLVFFVLRGWAQPELVPGTPATPVVNDPVPALLAQLRLTDPEKRMTALQRLSQLNDPRVIPALTEAMGAGALFVRIEAVRAYRNLGARAPLPPLLAVLRDPAPELRLEAMLTLWLRFDNAVVPPEAIDAVIAATRDGNDVVRYFAVDLLRCIPGPVSQLALLTAVRDPSADVRARAISQLADAASINADRTVIDAVTVALHDETASVRVAAATTLGRCRADQVTAPLLSALRDLDPDVRAAAARALTGSDTPQVIDALIVAAGDREPQVRLAVILALRSVNEPRVGETLLALLRDPDEDVQLTAAQALARRGDARVPD